MSIRVPEKANSNLHQESASQHIELISLHTHARALSSHYSKSYYSSCCKSWVVSETSALVRLVTWLHNHLHWGLVIYFRILTSFHTLFFHRLFCIFLTAIFTISNFTKAKSTSIPLHVDVSMEWWELIRSGNYHTWLHIMSAVDHGNQSKLQRSMLQI